MLLHSFEPYYLWVGRPGLMTNKRSQSRLEGWNYKTGVEGTDDSEGFTFVDSTDLPNCIGINTIWPDDDIPPLPMLRPLPYLLLLTLSLDKQLFRNPIQSRTIVIRFIRANYFAHPALLT